ncbi:MAG: putative lipid II flippase FtsW [bacterium]|nr:putative lipid II flippase FtsW [bacterium]
MTSAKNYYVLPDYRLLVIVYIIVAFGISMVYSASIQISKTLYDNQYHIFRSQLYWLILGTVLLLVTLNLDYRIYLKFSRLLLVVNLILLALVLVPGIGTKVAGSRSWIRYREYGFQPSELVKISLILYLAAIFNKPKINVSSFLEGYLPPLIVSTIAFFLILLEPDVGTGFLVAIIIGFLFFVSGIRVKFLTITLFSLLPFIYILISRVAYRKMRLLTFFNPSMDPADKGYHLLQSIKCFTTAGLLGKGIGNGVQKLWYLPQAHTDFIFSVIGEETGFIGISVLLFLFMYMLARAMRITMRAPDKFSFLVGAGICIMWSVQIIINIFVAVGLIPITGLPLPFISYGGSSLVVNMISVGILLSISRSIRPETV